MYLPDSIITLHAQDIVLDIILVPGKFLGGNILILKTLFLILPEI